MKIKNIVKHFQPPLLRPLKKSALLRPLKIRGPFYTMKSVQPIENHVNSNFTVKKVNSIKHPQGQNVLFAPLPLFLIQLHNELRINLKTRWENKYQFGKTVIYSTVKTLDDYLNIIKNIYWDWENIFLLTNGFDVCFYTLDAFPEVLKNTSQ